VLSILAREYAASSSSARRRAVHRGLRQGAGDSRAYEDWTSASVKLILEIGAGGNQFHHQARAVELVKTDREKAHVVLSEAARLVLLLGTLIDRSPRIAEKLNSSSGGRTSSPSSTNFS